MTRLTLHRGANRVAPENTLAAAHAAIALGADVLEVDVRTTADGSLVNLHDETVERTTDGRGALADLGDAAVRALDAGAWFAPRFAGEPVPFLDDLLERLAGQIDVFFDVKAADPHALGALIARHGLEERSYILAEDEALSRALVEAIPGGRHMVQRRAIGDAALARAKGYAIIEFTPRELSEATVAQARAAGLAIQVWCAHDDPAAFEAMLAHGVDYANVDHPESFARVRARLTR